MTEHSYLAAEPKMLYLANIMEQCKSLGAVHYTCLYLCFVKPRLRSVPLHYLRYYLLILLYNLWHDPNKRLAISLSSTTGIADGGFLLDHIVTEIGVTLLVMMIELYAQMGKQGMACCIILHPTCTYFTLSA